MTKNQLKILIPSIIDPMLHRGGAGSVTRSLLKILEIEPLNAKFEYIIPTSPFQKFHQLRQLTSILKSFFSDLPAKAIFTYSRNFLQSIKKRLEEEHFDLIIINGSDLIWLISELQSDLPIILIAHNIEYQLFLSQINSINPYPLVRQFLLRDYERLKNYELSGLPKIKNIICLSNDDAQLMLNNYPDLNLLTVYPLFDYEPTQENRTNNLNETIDIGFMGNFTWWPNRHGLNWFLENVFPHTKEHIKLHLFGEESQDLTSSSPRIVNHGFVPNIQDVLSQIDLMICPIFVGGGVNIKFAEAIYNGVPVLASSFSQRGFQLQPDASIILLDHPEEWVDFLNSVNVHSLRKQKISVSLSNLFSAKLHIESVQSFVQEVVQKNS
jgi:glycosyltransferase involved in cell wall biosynthesis